MSAHGSNTDVQSGPSVVIVLDMSKILIVEDCSVEATFTALLLRDKYETEIVETFADAVKVFNPHIHNAVILDLGLPDARGKTGTLEDFHAACPDAPVIVSTAHPNVTRRECIQSGAVGFVSKNGFGLESSKSQLLSEIDRATKAHNVYQCCDAFA